MTWQPIETSPKDGSDILIKREEAGEGVAYRVVYWESDAIGDYHWHVDDSGYGFNHHDTFPTHWMHLPA